MVGLSCVLVARSDCFAHLCHGFIHRIALSFFLLKIILLGERGIIELLQAKNLARKIW